METHKEVLNTQKSIVGMGWRVRYEGTQKAISGVLPGPLTHSRPKSFQQTGKAGCSQCIGAPGVDTG